MRRAFGEKKQKKSRRDKGAAPIDVVGELGLLLERRRVLGLLFLEARVLRLDLSVLVLELLRERVREVVEVRPCDAVA